MPTKTNSPVYWAGLTRVPLGSGYLHEDFSRPLNNEVSRLRVSSRGVSNKALEDQLGACKWLIEALYQGFCCLPRLPVALARGKANYLKSSGYRLPYGYRVIDRTLKAAVSLGFVEVVTGKYKSNNQGAITRIFAMGELLLHFRRYGICWQKLPPPQKNEGVFINEGRGSKGRRLAVVTDHPEVARIQRNLYEINVFLSKQCIYLNLKNSDFNQPADKFVSKGSHSSTYPRGSAGSLPVVNFQNVFLSRIFTKDSFKMGHRLEGGRFYHGWWQNIRKEYRPKIVINDFETAECDYSGMVICCLYALEGLDIGTNDPYDIGITYKGVNDPRRDLVKRYVVAILNDKNGKYRLSKGELNTLGLTHSQLSDGVRKRHNAISSHFGTGVGLRLQYIDSCVAERVMLKFTRMGEVCLPIHDSFIVRYKLLNKLENIMKNEYKRLLKKPISVKYGVRYQGVGISNPDSNIFSERARLTVDELNKGMAAHLKQYSVVMRYREIWKAQISSQAVRT